MSDLLSDPANQLTEELQLTPERLADIAEDGYIVDGEAQEMARRLLAAEVELQARWKADQPTDDERIMEIEGIAPPAPQPSRMSGIMPDYEGVAMTQRECYMAGKEAGLAEARKSPVIPDGYVLVPVEPTVFMRKAFQKANDEADSFVSPDHQWGAMLAAAQEVEGE